MYRTIRVLAVGIFSATLAVPSSYAMGIKFGLKAGLNMSKFYGKDVVADPGGAYKSTMGPVGGGFLLLDAPGNLDLQGEILYSSKGVVYEEENYKGTYTLGYVEIPVLLKYGIPSPGLVKPSLFVGASISSLVLANSEVETPAGTEEVNIKDTLAASDFGAVFGASVLITKFLVDVRYTLGLTTIQKEADLTSGEKPQMKNGTISASLGVSF